MTFPTTVVGSLLLVAVTSCVTALHAVGHRELEVFLFAGQSNMAGGDSVIADPPGFQQTEADKAAWFTVAPLPQGEKALQYLPWGGIQGHRIAAGGKLVHGPEVGFARELYRGGWRNVAIIKVYGNFPRTADRWPWGPEGAFYTAWTKFADARLRQLQAQGYRYRVRGFIWHQGIDDAIHGKLAASYRQNLTTLIGALRNRYGSESTPFVLARSGNSPIAGAMTGSRDDDPMAVVRRAQTAVGASVPHVRWVDVDDLSNVAQHHFTADAQLTIGARFGEAFLKLAEANCSRARNRLNC